MASPEFLAYVERCVDVVKARHPKIAEKATAYGWNQTPHHMFIKMDDEWFKFPRHEEADATVAMQAALLPQLAKRLSVAVPQFKFWEPTAEPKLLPSSPAPALGFGESTPSSTVDAERPSPPTSAETTLVPVAEPASEVGAWQDRFVWYRKIAGYSIGDLLEGKVLTSVRIAKGLGGLASAIHRFDVKAAVDAGVPLVTGEELYETFLAIYAVARSTPKLVEHELHFKTVEAFFQMGLSDDEVFSFMPRLIHGNVVEDVLIDDKLKPRGLVGWGDALVGDPAWEFGWMMWKCEEDLIGDFMEGYEPLENPETLWRRIMFYWGMAYMFEAIDSARKGDDAFMVYCLDFLREHVPARMGRMPTMAKKSLLTGMLRLGR